MGVWMTLFMTYIIPYIMEDILGFEKEPVSENPVTNLFIKFVLFSVGGFITAKFALKKKQKNREKTL